MGSESSRGSKVGGDKREGERRCGDSDSTDSDTKRVGGKGDKKGGGSILAKWHRELKGRSSLKNNWDSSKETAY